MTDSSKPWDRPPFPKRGNRSDRSLFEALGRTLNAWEEIEIALAHLYAAFTTGDRFDSAANHAYGAEANFNRRSATLQSAAASYFVSHPSQEIEGEFCRLARLVTGYAARRNDMAHSHALPIQWMPHSIFRTPVRSGGPAQWWLLPPHFRADKFTARHLPSYAFSSWEINEFGNVFWDIAHALSNLALLVAREPPSRGMRLRPGALPYKVRDPRIRRG